MKVKQFNGPNGPANNQIIIYRDDGSVLFISHGATIVKMTKDCKYILDEKMWDYRRTTGKYRNLFLGESKADTLKKIKTGEYTLADLNPEE